jgi:hypothetical protein
MINPHGHHQRDLHDFAERVDRRVGTAPPAHSGSTTWWAAKAALVVSIVVLGCAGLGGVIQSSAMRCHDVSHRTCLSLVIDDLTRSKPARRAD